MANTLKARLRAEKACVNGWSTLPCGLAAETMVKGGWDSVTIDMQHGLHDYASVVSCVQAMQAYPVTIMARVPWNEPGIIGKVLDAGIWGVICPMVNCAADAQALTDACFYPPLGTRSYGPIRAAGQSSDGMYHATANDEIIVLPQVETFKAVENIAEIIDVSGISGIYVGPSDLGFSMGLPPTIDRDEPEILSIYGRLLEETSRRGLISGIQTNTPQYAAKMIALGFRFVTVGSDLGFIARGARTAIAAARSGADKAPGN